MSLVVIAEGGAGDKIAGGTADTGGKTTGATSSGASRS